MQRSVFIKRLAAVLAGLVVTGGLYVLLGLGALALGYSVFGGSGHPPAPKAPDWLYILTYLVILPALSIAAGLWSGRALWRWLGASGATQRAKH